MGVTINTYVKKIQILAEKQTVLFKNSYRKKNEEKK